MNYNYYESENKPNPSNYITLGDYNEVYPLAKFKPCPKDNSQENYGAFSLYASVRYPWSCDRNSPSCENQKVVPGVN
jgi:hypothetical protein